MIAIAAPTLEELEARYVELSEQREAAATRAAAHSEEAELAARVESFRGDLKTRPAQIVQGAVRTLRKNRSDAEQDLAGLDDDLAALAVLIEQRRSEQDAARQAELVAAFEKAKRQS